jgi:hypothetical protein
MMISSLKQKKISIKIREKVNIKKKGKNKKKVGKSNIF